MSDKICTFVYHFKNKNMIYICRKSFQSIENGEGYYLGCEIDYEEFNTLGANEKRYFVNEKSDCISISENNILTNFIDGGQDGNFLAPY